jgi:hypothetical protein
MTDESRPRRTRSAYTDAEHAALRQLEADEGDPIELWKALRQLPGGWDEGLPDTDRIRIVRGLCHLSDASAIALVETREAPADVAAEIGHRAHNSFIPPEVKRAYQAEMMARVAKGEPLDAIDDTSVMIVSQDRQDSKQSRRIFNDREWSYWHTMSWIAFRDPARLLKIRRDQDLWYDAEFLVKNPKFELAKARGTQIVIDTGKLVPLVLKNGAVDPATRFSAKAVRSRWKQERSQRVETRNEVILGLIAGLPPGLSVPARNTLIENGLKNKGHKTQSHGALTRAIQRANQPVKPKKRRG